MCPSSYRCKQEAAKHSRGQSYDCYASLVLPNLPHITITWQTHAKHEPIIIIIIIVKYTLDHNISESSEPYRLIVL